MILRTAIALIALAIPAVAQRGGAHAGSFGGRSSAGHVGFSGSAGFSQPRGFAVSAPSVRYGAFGGVGYRRAVPPNYSSYRIPYNQNRLNAGLVPYRQAGASGSRTAYRGPFDARRRSFENWYLSNYPAWLGYGYPYAIDPGFYDWGDSETAAYDQGFVPDYPPPYPDEGYGASPQQPAALPPNAASAPVPNQPLTVIFKNGRAPAKMQNYMMTPKVLTDLDPLHYEQIPLDQVDVVATRWANGAAGVAFQVPGASRD
jgi:hypothetical protein